MSDIKEINDEKLEEIVGGGPTSDQSIQYRATINNSMCVECGFCMSVNCGAVLVVPGGKYYVDQALCNGCRKCFDCCPVGAISMGV